MTSFSSAFETMAKSQDGRNPRPQSDPALRKRARQMLRTLRRTFPQAGCSLDFTDPFELMVATILSAQCTDAQVNKVTPELFRRFPDAQAFAEAPLEEIEEAIHSTGFYHNKAKNIQGAARGVLERFGGRVPETLSELLTLPGVGRKTGNVVLGVAFQKAEGVVVDTHAMRVSRRMGWTTQKTPEKIERDLMELFPQKDWIALTHLLILHGRRFCPARKPHCEECPLNEECPRILERANGKNR